MTRKLLFQTREDHVNPKLTPIDRIVIWTIQHELPNVPVSVFLYEKTTLKTLYPSDFDTLIIEQTGTSVTLTWKADKEVDEDTILAILIG